MIARAIKSGGRGYFSKRASTELLKDAVRVVAGGGLYLSPGISPKVLSTITTGEGDAYDKLTRRERQVLQLIADGRGIRQIATELNTAVRTINVHRYNLMKKLDIHSQPQLVRYAFEHGLVLPGG
jgi:two-component system, NarL family, response regulator NreC